MSEAPGAPTPPPPPPTTAPSAPQATPAAPADPRVWHRFHPITPVIKGWKVLLVLLFVVAQQAGENIAAAAEALSSVGVWTVLAVPAAVLLLATGYAALAWRMSRYAVDASAVFLHTGVLFRQQRTARLDRIQAIDVVQPLLGRVFGLAELKIEVAGGADSAVRLSFLREQHAQELRAELLARAAGLRIGAQGAPGATAHPLAGPHAAPSAVAVVPVDAGAGVPPVPPPPGVPGAPVPGAPGVPGLGVPAIPVAPEREVVAVATPRLLASLVRSAGVLTLVAILVALVIAVVATGETSILVGTFPAVFTAGGYLWGRFTGEFNFRVAISPDGIRLRHGLLEARAQTVPPGRVQAVRLMQPLLWRGKDWWRLQMNVAGYGTGGQENGRQVETVLLPVGDREEALRALWLVLPDLGVDGDPRVLLDAALTGSGPGGGFVTEPHRARWLDPLTWRRRGVAITGRAVIVRGGRLWRTVTLVPHEKTQSLGLTQGPLERRLGLASLALHSTPGPIVPVVPHLDAVAAARLLDEQASRARIARGAAVPERWMAGRVGGPA